MKKTKELLSSLQSQRRKYRIKKTDFNKYEDGYLKRVDKEPIENKTFEYNELAQEKMFLDELYKQLERHEAKSQEVIDSLSHEIRTPIVTIKAYADMLLSGKFGEPTQVQKEKLLLVQESTEELMHVVMQMLNKMKEE